MSWVKPATVAAAVLFSAVALGYAAFSKWRQSRNTPNQGYTYANHLGPEVFITGSLWFTGNFTEKILKKKTIVTNNKEWVDYCSYAHPREKRKRQCGICLKEVNSSEEVTLPCGHSFCPKCLIPLYFGTQTTCCDCRKELNPHDLNVLKRRLLN